MRTINPELVKQIEEGHTALGRMAFARAVHDWKKTAEAENLFLAARMIREMRRALARAQSDLRQHRIADARTQFQLAELRLFELIFGEKNKLQPTKLGISAFELALGTTPPKYLALRQKVTGEKSPPSQWTHIYDVTEPNPSLSDLLLLNTRLAALQSLRHVRDDGTIIEPLAMQRILNLVGDSIHVLEEGHYDPATVRIVGVGTGRFDCESNLGITRGNLEQVRQFVNYEVQSLGWPSRLVHRVRGALHLGQP